MDALTSGEFAELIGPLGPFEPAPRLAVAVSGGADSLALALLAHGWASLQGGDALGLIVDHGLRAESTSEAEITRQRLAERGIAAQVLTLTELAAGSGLASRARAARYDAMERACAASGRVHLLLGHHAADQAETVAMRLLAGSFPHGLAAMPALHETARVRMLRPLLGVPPVRLRATLIAAGLAWVDDPSNANPLAQRARLRAARRDRDGIGPATMAAVAAAAARGDARARDEQAMAVELALRASIFPEGYALLTQGKLRPDTLAALLRTIAGAHFLPPPGQVAELAAAPRPATLGGARLLPAGRLLSGGWLVVREAAAMAPSVAAAPGAVWDGRFRLATDAAPPDQAELGALGDAASGLRKLADLPAAVLQTLPAVRSRGKLVAVPPLSYGEAMWSVRCALRFTPGRAVTDAPFVPPVSAAAKPCVMQGAG
jgi:tRNA(Ile)-lysidine synthase